MGVHKLWDILESCKQIIPLHHLQNKRVCIDLSYWIIQLHNAGKSHSFIKEKLFLKNLFHRLRALIALNCSVIFVTDGSIPAIKSATYRRRLGEVLQDETNSQRSSSIQRNKGSEFSCMVKEAKALGMALGIPCLDGVEEAEAQCALLNSESLCDGCFTADSDVFLFGARTVYKDIYLGEGGYVVCYEMVDIERKLGLGRNSMITLALLLGGDYSQGIHGLGPETACQIVKSIGEENVLCRIASEGLVFAKKTKGAKKQDRILNCNGNKENGWDHKQDTASVQQIPQTGEQFSQVINAYLKPKCHSADSMAVHKVLVQIPFQRTRLQEICAESFGWTPEKTDDYILPKIAERDLRRFANLRSVSSEVGVQALSRNLPVACPVATIVKHRKLHGEECFEVAWEGVAGLKTSVISSDLVKSACPEKLEEFYQRRAETKKMNRKSRPKKSEDRATLTEIDLKLQALLVSIENQDNLPRVSTCHQPTGPSVNDAEVIDLSTPSPPVRASKNTRCHRPICQQVDAIDVYESESDVSPEHEKKARELRLFLASIKGDISSE